MSKRDDYRKKLSGLKTWEQFLLKESGLPGPRGNIELAQAVADEGDEKIFRRYLAYDALRAPANSPEEFLAFCGVVGLGRLVAEGRTGLLPLIRAAASDVRWRTREAAAMALQRVGDENMELVLHEAGWWSRGTLLEQRGAAAAVSEPRLLKNKEHVKKVPEILDGITEGIKNVKDRRSEEFRILKKGLGYSWSVAVAALPGEGKKRMERWLRSSDRDIAWIMKENLKKNRLRRIDRPWAEKWERYLSLQRQT